MTERYVEYTAHFVDDIDELVRQHPPLLESIGKVRAHHVTIEHEPFDGVEGVVVGRKRTLLGIGYVVTAEVHAILVQGTNGETVSKSRFPHVTVATAPGVSPVVSNVALEYAIKSNTIVPLNPPLVIRTTEGYSDGKQVVTVE